jgi:hypothetical protein
MKQTLNVNSLVVPYIIKILRTVTKYQYNRKFIRLQHTSMFLLYEYTVYKQFEKKFLLN